MKRTAWPRRLPPTGKRVDCSEEKQPPALMECAPVAIKKIVKSTAVMARISDLPHTAITKEPENRNRALLDMARDRHCLLRIAGVCQGGTETTVACHSNWACHGKAGARKASDAFSVWGCGSCHHWLDQIAAPKATKRAAFMRAHADQVLAWRRITQDTSESPRFRKAAQWALEALNATPNLPATA